MYDIKTIEKTLDLLDRYDGQFAKTARETGIKVGTIRSWFNKKAQRRTPACEAKEKAQQMVGRAEESRSGLLLRARRKRREGLQKTRIPIAFDDEDLGPRRPAVQEEESHERKPQKSHRRGNEEKGGRRFGGKEGVRP